MCLTNSSSSSAGTWAALAVTSSGAADFTARAGSGSGLKPQHTIACLSVAPVLADLAIWSDWDSLYGPMFGPLVGFLEQHREGLGFQVLELPGGVLLKLPAGAGLDLAELRQGWKLALEQVNCMIACILASLLEPPENVQLSGSSQSYICACD
jgi:hypothetical protein